MARHPCTRCPRSILPKLIFLPILLVVQLTMIFAPSLRVASIQHQANLISNPASAPVDQLSPAPLRRFLYPAIDGPHGNDTDCDYLWILGYNSNSTDYLGKWYYRQRNETVTECNNETGFSIFLSGCRPHPFPDGTYPVDWEHSGGIALWIFVLFELMVGVVALMPRWEYILQIIADRLHMSDDVAGATLMSAGTSSTNFYIVMMGLGNTQSTLGAGAILGSCLWNTLAIVGGVCVLAPGGFFKKMLIDYRAIWRDTTFCIFTYLWVTFAFRDGFIDWYESMAAVLMYIVYLLFLWQQWNFYKIFTPFYTPFVKKWFCCCIPDEKIVTRTEHHTEADLIKKEDAQEAAVAHAQARVSLNLTRASFDVTRGDPSQPGQEAVPLPSVVVPDIVEPEAADSSDDSTREIWRKRLGCRKCFVSKKGKKYPWWWPIWCFWEYPWKLMYAFSIPRPTIGKKYCGYGPHFTFWCCIFWLILNTYLLVLATIQFGCILNMTDDLLGVTLLAMTSTFPDFMSSATVARKGMGSFGIANGLASNSFNNLICLGLPFLISFFIFQKPVEVGTETLSIYIAWAWIALAIVNFTFAAVQFKVNKVPGVIFLTIYAMFIAFCVAYNKLAFPWANPHP